jgi:hypothetical protein
MLGHLAVYLEHTKYIPIVSIYVIDFDCEGRSYKCQILSEKRRYMTTFTEQEGGSELLLTSHRARTIISATVGAPAFHLSSARPKEESFERAPERGKRLFIRKMKHYTYPNVVARSAVF